VRGLRERIDGDPRARVAQRIERTRTRDERREDRDPQLAQ
jgi:hypothetical protein